MSLLQTTVVFEAIILQACDSGGTHTWNFLDFMFIYNITHRFMHGVEVEMDNCEKLLED